MEAKDLMVGDWIYAIDSEGNKHPCRANNLQYDYTNKRDDFCVDFYGTNHESKWPDITYEVEPIPLTPEILKENGFVYSELPFEQSWQQFGLSLYSGGDGYRVNCGNNVSAVIDSVHQLQHLLKLCGIDKEITL